MGSCPPVYSYQASLRKKYNANVQAQNKYRTHNDNPGNKSVNITGFLSKKTGYDNSHLNRIKCS